MTARGYEGIKSRTCSREEYQAILLHRDAGLAGQLMVAGGSGLYSMVMPNWAGTDHANSEVSVLVENNFFTRFRIC